MGRLTARNKYLYDGAEKFFVRGVSYGTFAPNSKGDGYPEPDQVERDFSLMSKLGANVVRTYEAVPAWMCELAAKHGLRLMVGMPWPSHLAFLDSPEMTRDIRATIGKAVSEMKPFGASLFAYTIGNEIPPDIVRWHGRRAVSRFLAELFDIAKQRDPETLVTYANFPSTEYLDISFFDFLSFNVYLHREADFRRYLTHLLAMSGDRPVLLSETGMDTMREGEQHQAELLRWQARVGFELGLCGLVAFAFTDEWYRGGNEITDWAFGLVRRDRSAKLSFSALSAIFKGELPPPLSVSPRASVVVPAYNAAPTLGQCLDSLAKLNYPDYEIIVVDDGSTDATAQITNRQGVRTVSLPHRGLSAARNAGIAAAQGRIVGFIDADATADRDWLYHLVEALTRADAPVAGGRTFTPASRSTIASAIAAAPGAPREVRLGADQLAQVCGCSMALDRSKFGTAEIFDETFDSAGDDVDLSWRLRESGSSLVYAGGAIALHESRKTIGAYLRQQGGYGRAEGLLFRKYPDRSSGEPLYGSEGWLASWFSMGARVYYGTFGRALFQTLYPGAVLPLAAQLPLSAPWLAVSLILIVAGLLNRILGLLGIAGIILFLASACAGAWLTPGEAATGLTRRLTLGILWLLGPIVRSCARERMKWKFAPDTAGAPAMQPRRSRGKLLLIPTQVEPTRSFLHEDIIEAMHAVLVRRGMTTRKSYGYAPYDLQLIIPPWARIAILMLEQPGHISVGWRTAAASRRIGIAGAILGVLLLAGFSIMSAFAVVLLLALFAGAIAFMRARRAPAVIAAAAAEIATRFGMRLEVAPAPER